MTTGCSSPPPRFTSVTVMVIGPPSSCSALSWSLLGTIVSRRSLTLFDITDLHFVGDRPTGERQGLDAARVARPGRSEEHTSELQSLMRLSYAVLCLKTKKNKPKLFTDYNR